MGNSCHGVDHHQYADDIQLFRAIAASTIYSNLSTLEICSQVVKDWIADNDLCWMPTSPRWCLSDHQHSWRLHQASYRNSRWRYSTSSVMKSLGAVIDSRLTFDTHVRAFCKACNYHTWALRHIRHYIPLPVAHTLAWSIVGSRLDYCNSVFYSAPKSSIAKF